jgi:hypothetical protein
LMILALLAVCFSGRCLYFYCCCYRPSSSCVLESDEDGSNIDIRQTDRHLRCTVVLLDRCYYHYGGG